MQTILRSLAIALICGAMCTTYTDARGRHENGRGNARQETRRDAGKGQTRKFEGTRDARRDAQLHPGGNQARKERDARRATDNRRPQGIHNGATGSGNHRPDNRPTQRPDGRPNHRPDNRPTHRPDGRPNQRPDNRPTHRPDGRPNQRPDNRPNHRPDYRPDHGHHYGHHHVHYGRPKRPMMPPPRPYYRPVPPPRSWRPPVWRPFHTILGVTLGSAINISINALLSNGYDVSGYDNSVVYLSNVPMLNYSWPAANLYYGDAGLYGSEFVYSTSGYNMRRYNDVYRSLATVYGSPYLVQNLDGGGRRATWWGDNGQYITLSFGGSYASGGGLRYYTTLSFGR